MPGAIAVLEKLLDDPETQVKEHVLETASPHIANAQARFEERFDSIVNEISTIWGEPSFNSHLNWEGHPSVTDRDSQEEQTDSKRLSTVVPKWCVGTARSGGQPKTLRMASWSKPDSLKYVCMRTEIDPRKDRPLYYDIVLGAKRKNQEVSRGSEKLRHTKEHWMSNVVSALNWFRGR